MVWRRHIGAVIAEREDQRERRAHRPGRKPQFDKAAYHICENAGGAPVITRRRACVSPDSHDGRREARTEGRVEAGVAKEVVVMCVTLLG